MLQGPDSPDISTLNYLIILAVLFFTYYFVEVAKVGDNLINYTITLTN